MAVCIYDNPKTRQRECWMDGVLLHKFSSSEVYSIPKHFYLGKGHLVEGWNAGNIIGRKEAMHD